MLDRIRPDAVPGLDGQPQDQVAGRGRDPPGMARQAGRQGHRIRFEQPEPGQDRPRPIIAGSAQLGGPPRTASSSLTVVNRSHETSAAPIRSRKTTEIRLYNVELVPFTHSSIAA